MWVRSPTCTYFYCNPFILIPHDLITILPSSMIVINTIFLPLNQTKKIIYIFFIFSLFYPFYQTHVKENNNIFFHSNILFSLYFSSPTFSSSILVIFIFIFWLNSILVYLSKKTNSFICWVSDLQKKKKEYIILECLCFYLLLFLLGLVR